MWSTKKTQRELKINMDAKHPAVNLEKHHKTSMCQFQASTRLELRKHLITLKHKAASGVNIATLGQNFKCKDCGDEFSDMNHRRDTHLERRRKCRNYF